jgi:Flp pilus assembly protein TadG
MRRRWRSLMAEPERGSVTIEMILITPVLIAFLLLMVALGQVVSARLSLDSAATAAARAASVATSPEAAVAAAQQSVSGAGSLGCSTVNVATNTADFVAGGNVAVTLTCSFNLAPFAGLHLPSTETFSSTFSEPLDQYKTYQQ